MFTLDEVLAAKPTNSPISAGDYWAGILRLAEVKVKGMTGRALEPASYTDAGHTTPDAIDSTKYVWYLREPTGTALAFSVLSAFTLGGETVAEADVTIGIKRLIFTTAGDVAVTYPGGYMRDTTVKAVLLQIVIDTMHTIHRGMQEGTVPDLARIRDGLMPYSDCGYDAVRE